MGEIRFRAVLITALLAIVVAAFSFRAAAQDIEFNKELWLDAQNYMLGPDIHKSEVYKDKEKFFKMHSIRKKMVVNLVSEYLQEGMIKQEIIALLGKGREYSNCMDYILGYCGVGIDYCALKTCFTESGQLTEVELVENDW